MKEAYYVPVIYKNTYGLTHNPNHPTAKEVKCTVSGTVYFLNPLTAQFRGVPPTDLTYVKWTEFNRHLAKQILESEPLLAALVCTVGRIQSMDNEVKPSIVQGYLNEYLIDSELLLACTKSHALQIEKILKKLDE